VSEIRTATSTWRWARVASSSGNKPGCRAASNRIDTLTGKQLVRRLEAALPAPPSPG